MAQLTTWNREGGASPGSAHVVRERGGVSQGPLALRAELGGISACVEQATEEDVFFRKSAPQSLWLAAWRELAPHQVPVCIPPNLSDIICSNVVLKGRPHW